MAGSRRGYRDLLVIPVDLDEVCQVSLWVGFWFPAPSSLVDTFPNKNPFDRSIISDKSPNNAVRPCSSISSMSTKVNPRISSIKVSRPQNEAITRVIGFGGYGQGCVMCIFETK